MGHIILIMGSLNMDLVTRTTTFPSAGETRTALSFTTGPGGKGANQAVACARALKPNLHKYPAKVDETLQIEVCMIGAVGEDIYGKQLKSELSKNGIDTSGIECAQSEVSGVAVIIVEEGSGENRILITPGANALVKPLQFYSLLDKLETVQLIVLQLEIPLETVLAVIEHARRSGIETVLNPAPAIALPEHSLRALGHLIMNETEAKILSDVEDDVSAGNDASLREVFRKFNEIGVRNTVVTLGAQGVCYSTGGGQFGRVSACKVENVVDTTAAGDTFVGYYAVEVVRCKVQGNVFDIREAVVKANRAAARTVERPGAMSSIPWMDEISGE